MICTRCNLQQARMSILLKDSSSSSAGVSKQSRSSIYILNIRSWCNLPMLAAPLSFFILIRPSSARRRHSHWTPLKYLVSGQWCSWIFAFLALVLGLQEVLSLREFCVHGNWILVVKWSSNKKFLRNSLNADSHTFYGIEGSIQAVFKGGLIE